MITKYTIKWKRSIHRCMANVEQMQKKNTSSPEKSRQWLQKIDNVEYCDEILATMMEKKMKMKNTWQIFEYDKDDDDDNSGIFTSKNSRKNRVFIARKSFTSAQSYVRTWTYFCATHAQAHVAHTISSTICANYVNSCEFLYVARTIQYTVCTVHIWCTLVRVREIIVT